MARALVRPARSVTLVVVDAAGELLGQLPEFAVATPWWQDIEPISALRPELTVLRLLHVEPAADGPMGGDVSYLAECSQPPIGLREFGGRAQWLGDHALRMPWARPGGPTADLAWAAEHVEFTGRPRQFRSWNLSAIWRIPTAHGDCWLKCLPPFLDHEAAVLARLGPSPSLPRLIAADGHRLLLAGMPGTDGYAADVPAFQGVLQALVALLSGAGGSDWTGVVPDWRADAFGAALEEVVARAGSGLPGLRGLLAGWDDRFAALADCGLPDTLFHGDAHPGNARVGVHPAVVFDWGDSGLGHPLLDLRVLDGAPAADQPVLRRFWLRLWAEAVPGSDPERAWSLLAPAAAARAAVVYQGFLDGIEPSERIYHRDDVRPALLRAEQLLAGR